MPALAKARLTFPTWENSTATRVMASSSGFYVFVCDDPNHPSLSRLQARLYGDWLADAFDPPNKIAISGDTAAIGWSKEGIFVYTRCGTNWSLAPAALKASDGAGFLTVALDGNTIAGGAPGYFAVPGAVYVYEPTRPRLINPV